MVTKHLDQIVVSVNDNAKAYSVKRVPLTLVYRIFDQGKVKHTSDQNTNEFITKFNDLLTTLKSLCKQTSDKIGDAAISPKEVQLLINAAKGAFVEGINSNQ